MFIAFHFLSVRTNEPCLLLLPFLESLLCQEIHNMHLFVFFSNSNLFRRFGFIFLLWRLLIFVRMIWCHSILFFFICFFIIRWGCLLFLFFLLFFLLSTTTTTASTSSSPSFCCFCLCWFLFLHQCDRKFHKTFGFVALVVSPFFLVAGFFLISLKAGPSVDDDDGSISKWSPNLVDFFLSLTSPFFLSLSSSVRPVGLHFHFSTLSNHVNFITFISLRYLGQYFLNNALLL